MRHDRPSRFAAAVMAVGSLIVLALGLPLLLNLGTRDLGFHGAAVHAAQADTYDISAPVDLAPTAGLRLEQGTVSLADPRKASLNPGGAALPQDGSAKLVIEAGRFEVAGVRSARDVLNPAEPSAPLIELVKALNFDTIVVRRGTAKIPLPHGRTEILSDITAEITARRRSSLHIRGSGTLRGQSLTFEVSTSGLNERKPGARLPVRVRINSPLLEISFDGRLGLSDVVQLQGQTEISAGNLRQTARWFGAPWPSGSGLRDMSIKGEIDWQAPAIAFDKAAFRMDGNEATGTIAITLDGPRPSVTGTLALQAFDITPYLSGPGNPTAPSLFSWFGSGESEFPLPMSRQIDADVRISASKVIVHGKQSGRFAASVSLNDGRLLADIAEIGIDSGRGSGQLTADLTDARPSLGVRGKLENVDAGRASLALFGHGALQGSSTFTLDLATAGGSVGEMLRGLKGKMTVSLREGGRIGLDVKSLVGAAQKNRVEGWALATRGQTTIDELEAKFRVDSGIVASESVEATAGDSLLRAIGTISLASRQIDLRLLLGAAPLAAARAQAAIPREVLVFQGPWSAPSIQLER